MKNNKIRINLLTIYVIMCSLLMILLPCITNGEILIIQASPIIVTVICSILLFINAASVYYINNKLISLISVITMILALQLLIVSWWLYFLVVVFLVSYIKFDSIYYKKKKENIYCLLHNALFGIICDRRY